MTVIHSEYGSRFVVDSALVGTLLSGPSAAAPPPSGMSAEQWTSLVDELVREKVLLDAHAYRRALTRNSAGNRLAPIEMAVLRGFNEGGIKDVRDGPPPPAEKRVTRTKAHALASHAPAEDTEALAGWLEARQSVRTYSSQPLSRSRLEQFLELTARAYARLTHPVLGTTSLRNYPSGGARYPLEIYPVLLNVASLPKGFYHYEPFRHELEYLGRKARYLDALRQVVRVRMDRPAADASEPAVLFAITAVHARVCWKYDGIPLQLILQETGALYQTMYLAATSMRLAPCAVGAFPERAVGAVLDLDPDHETQVGLFALGVTRESPRARAPLTIEGFTVRRGSPFSSDPSRHCVELRFAGGHSETIDARDLALTRTDQAVACLVQRGRRQAIFTGAALAAITRLISERNGVLRCRIGRGFVRVAT